MSETDSEWWIYQTHLGSNLGPPLQDSNAQLQKQEVAVEREGEELGREDQASSHNLKGKPQKAL